jgi:hypothetical protein
VATPLAGDVDRALLAQLLPMITTGRTDPT